MNYDQLILSLAQLHLQHLGFDPGPSDGIPGPRTRAAIEAYQRSVKKVPVVEMYQDKPWLRVALEEEARVVKEVGGKLHNPRIIEYHQTTSLRAQADEVPWCSAFINWCMMMAGIPGTGSAAARSWLSWGVALDTPRRGAVVVMSRGVNLNSGHVGLYVDEQNGRLMVLGGNQGDAISIAPFEKRTLIGYRWPKGNY